MTALRLGSLFDGIGVFPLAAVRCGIEPVWASEIENAPISITKRHFPDMAHLGDVTKLDGRDLPPVHIITFGSPCQNLSQIGNRKGLAGEKSSLFFQAIRIIREMREATNGLFPAIAVWENVMGAFSSNDRMDFRAVLSAFTDTDVSMPASGRWAGAGMVRGRTPDLCWRLMDAQHWSSPRLARRQRIFLVADFGGRRSHEILFKPRTMQSLPAFGGDRGLPAACGDRGSFIEAGRRVPVTRPFQCFRMRASAKERTETAFRNSFGLPTDPFPTLLFEAYITNLGKYAEGQLVGETLKFPATTEEVQSLLKNIGVDGVRYEEFFITAFDGDVMGLYDYLTEYENLDELNHLAHLISELDSDEIETLEAVLNKGDHTSSVADIINLVHNLDCYELHPGVTDDETLGRIYVEDMELLDVPDNVLPYFDFEAYGRDMRINEGGHFAPTGYLTRSGDFKEVYHGIEDIPAEHRIFAYPKLNIREQMAAYKEVIDRSSLEGERLHPRKEHDDR